MVPVAELAAGELLFLAVRPSLAAVLPRLRDTTFACVNRSSGLPAVETRPKKLPIPGAAD